jgi:prolyl-tRNA editing enzyme YbaK/EbsC (Cys-tRNA(Pro) deacylase)
MYRGFVDQTSKLLQQESRYHDTRYPDKLKDSVWVIEESASVRQVARAIGFSQREVAKTLYQDS